MSIHLLEDEKDLLSRLKAGDEKSFEQIYRHYYDNLHIHAYTKLGTKELAKDLVQDLFTVTWNTKEDITINISLTNYLYASVRNRVLDIWAKERNREKDLNSLVLDSTVTHVNAIDQLEEKMLTEQIENKLRHLSARVGQIFELSRNQSLTKKKCKSTRII
ncbi:MAG: RNA polymerase sigma factor [Sphingobacterium hotanense]